MKFKTKTNKTSKWKNNEEEEKERNKKGWRNERKKNMGVLASELLLEATGRLCMILVPKAPTSLLPDGRPL